MCGFNKFDIQVPFRPKKSPVESMNGKCSRNPVTKAHGYFGLDRSISVLGTKNTTLKVSFKLLARKNDIHHIL